ncbi:hypothetical protein AMECASPLE_000335, partial [Ameca splendens]
MAGSGDRWWIQLGGEAPAEWMNHHSTNCFSLETSLQLRVSPVVRSRAPAAPGAETQQVARLRHSQLNADADWLGLSSAGCPRSSSPTEFSLPACVLPCFALVAG